MRLGRSHFKLAKKFSPSWELEKIDDQVFQKVWSALVVTFFLGVLGNGHEVNWVFQVFRVTSVETLTRGACHLHIEMDKDKRGEWWFTPVFLGRVKNDYVETTDPILSSIFPTQGKQLGRNCHSYSYTLLSRGANVSGTLALHPWIIRAFWANAQLRLAFVHFIRAVPQSYSTNSSVFWLLNVPAFHPAYMNWLHRRRKPFA